MDVQKGFLDPIWGNRNNVNLESNIEKILTFWRNAENPIFHVRHNSFDSESPLRIGKEGFDFIECAKPLENEVVITKRVNSSFIGTSLELELRFKNISQLTLVGLTTDHCISTTARMGANLGFDISIISDAVATFGRSYNGNAIDAHTIHEVSLASLSTEFSKITTTESLIS